MAWGLERQRIFQDNRDREDFMHWLAALAESEALTVYAWRSLPDRFHLLIRIDQRPLSRSIALGDIAGFFGLCREKGSILDQANFQSTTCMHLIGNCYASPAS